MKLEFMKILNAKMVWTAGFAAIALNIFTLIIVGSQGEYSVFSALGTEIPRLKAEGAYFAGAITDEWISKHKAEIDAIRNDQTNWVSLEEQEEISRSLNKEKGLTDAYIDLHKSLFFLKEEIRSSNLYNSYESAEFSMRWYESVGNLGRDLGSNYLSRFPGKKGEVLSAKTQERYQYLAKDYTAFYNYDYGYQKMRNMMTTFP
jgi:hypothetical protein